MTKFLSILLAAALVFIISCSKDEGIPDNPTTATLSKEWFVRVQGPAATSNYSLFSTRVTNFIDSAYAQHTLADTITLDDHNQLNPTWRANVRINATARTFGAGQYKNWNGTDSVVITEGKIIRNGGRSRSGNTVDSIYIKYAFKSAPATAYILNGHARTGLVADEY